MNIRKRLRALPNPSQRKLTLFACSCVRKIWHLLKDERSKAAVIAAENHVHGLISEQELRCFVSAAYQAYLDDSDLAYAAYATSRIAKATHADADVWAADVVWAAYAAASRKEQKIIKQHQLFDDIFGS